MKFNEKLLELRKKEGLSQEELADKVDVSRQTVSKWESGQTTPEMEKLLELSKLFNISLDELTGNEVEKKDNNEEAKPTKKKHIILKVILVILAIYGIISLLKFILLTRHHLIVDSFNEESYVVSEQIVMYDEEAPVNPSYIYVYVKKDGDKYIEEQYHEMSEDALPFDITYVDFSENKAYDLIYEEEVGKYYVSDKMKSYPEKDKEAFWEGLKDCTPVKRITNIPDDLKLRLMYSLNPFIFYNPFSKTLLINIPFNFTQKSQYNGDYLMTNTIIKAWGYNRRAVYSVGYDYVPGHFDGNRVENPFEEYKDLIVFENN